MIDFHAHLDLYPLPRDVARECSARGLDVLSVTTTPSAWPLSAELAAGDARIRTALGLHPQIAHQRVSELHLFDEYLLETRYVGEVGLDGSAEFMSTWDQQVAVFNHILRACSQVGGRVISIHSRRAAASVLNCLEACPGSGIPILHWFSGSSRELDRAIAIGCWFSVGLPMLASARSRDLVTRIPRDRIVTETDGPFARLRGRAAMPWDAVEAVARLGEVWSVASAEASETLRENLRILTRAT